MHSLRTFACARLGLAAASLLVSSTAMSASGAQPCPVELVGVASERWLEAARSLANAPLDWGDCARIRLEISERGAHLTFATLDGRSAERALVEPEELRPTIEALQVSGPPSAPSTRSPAQDARPSSRGGASQSTSVAPAAERRDFGAAFALLAGARGGSNSLLSPLLSALVALSFRRWEWGITATWESAYLDMDSGPPVRKRSSGASLGLSAARRRPLGVVALLGGGRLAVAGLLRSQTEGPVGPTGSGHPADSSIEGRIGAYLGLALPRRGWGRFRVELGVDLVIARRPGDEQAIAPLWAFTGLVGAEIGRP